MAGVWHGKGVSRLEHGLARRLAVLVEQVRLGRSARRGLEGCHRCVSAVRADAVGTVADERTEVVRLLGVARLDQQPRARARLGAQEVLVHGGAREQRGHGQPVAPRRSVGEHEQRRLLLEHGRLRLRAQRVQRLAQRVRVGARLGRVDGRVERHRLPAAVLGRLECLHLAQREDGRRHEQPRRLIHWVAAGSHGVAGGSHGVAGRSRTVAAGSHGVATWSHGVAGSSRRAACSGVDSSKLPSGPTGHSSDMTTSSRIGSMGGLVTCAKSCLK